MLTEGDKDWLRDNHPGLVRSDCSVAGNIGFRAAYKREDNVFLILRDGQSDPAGFATLAGGFEIRIEERTDKSVSRLPSVSVAGLEPTEERHFGGDGTACLCSPFEEEAFLQPDFRFEPFVEQLVIPFLYGQVFYTSEGHWPWEEYAHGTTGILEAYSVLQTGCKVEECLRLLVRYPSWTAMRSALSHKPYVQGHTPCFCGSNKQIRRCHRKALEGALRLQREVRALGITLP